jgi:predicted nucleic acid-binding protein
MAGRISLCVNSDILNEYEEILAEKTNAEIARNVVRTIIRFHTTIFQQVYFHFGLIEADPDDNKFVDCAVAIDAEYIVTNDAHFNILKQIEWPRLTVIDIKEFTRQLDNT